MKKISNFYQQKITKEKYGKQIGLCKTLAVHWVNLILRDNGNQSIEISKRRMSALQGIISSGSALLLQNKMHYFMSIELRKESQKRKPIDQLYTISDEMLIHSLGLKRPAPIKIFPTGNIYDLISYFEKPDSEGFVYSFNIKSSYGKAYSHAVAFYQKIYPSRGCYKPRGSICAFDPHMGEFELDSSEVTHWLTEMVAMCMNAPVFSPNHFIIHTVEPLDVKSKVMPSISW